MNISPKVLYTCNRGAADVADPRQFGHVQLTSLVGGMMAKEAGRNVFIKPVSAAASDIAARIPHQSQNPVPNNRILCQLPPGGSQGCSRDGGACRKNSQSLDWEFFIFRKSASANYSSSWRTRLRRGRRWYGRGWPDR